MAPDPDPDADARLLGDPGAALVVVGHTHLQFHRRPARACPCSIRAASGCRSTATSARPTRSWIPMAASTCGACRTSSTRPSAALRALGEPWTALFEERLQRASA
jgi:hypothetical protein